MAKARKPLTAEQKAKNIENLKKARDAKAAKNNQPQKTEAEQPAPEVQESKVKPAEKIVEVPSDVEVPERAVPINSEDQPEPAKPESNAGLVEMLVKMQREIDQLKAGATQPTPEQALEETARMTGANVGAQGVQGRIFRYPVEKGHYPDPTPRLYDDPQLKRFAMRENFYFKWDVEGETYEKYGVTYSEPRFVVELYRFLFDEEGKPTGKMIFVNRQFQMEDELAARIIADRLGMSEKFETHEELMNEMRFQRIRQWLLGVFTPYKVEQHRRKPVTTVIDGKVVEMYDTEQLTDKDSGTAKAADIQRQVAIPE